MDRSPVVLLDETADVFFFHAEDGIRDWSVTGVQTCALPISATGRPEAPQVRGRDVAQGRGQVMAALRSEERRVGKECRSRVSPYHQKKVLLGNEQCVAAVQVGLGADAVENRVITGRLGVLRS